MRKLAGTFIEGVLPRLGIKIGSDHALWAWAARHARWVLNRFRPVEGATPYELVYGKSFKGLLAEYGEPVHGYIKSLNKGGARWRVCLFLGKVERQDQDWRADNLEFRLTELSGIWKEMPFRWIMGRINTLHNYARRIHSGLILNGGFVEREIPNTHATSVYDMLNEMNAGHYLARRSLEEMQRTAGLFYRHQVMLQAAMNEASPAEGPVYTRFRPGGREPSIRQDYEAAQANQMCGRLEAKVQQLAGRHYNFARKRNTRGQQMQWKENLIITENVGFCTQDERTSRCTT